MNVERLFDIVAFVHEKHHKEIALAGKRNGKWVTYSSQDYINYTNWVSSGLLHLGIEKGDRILNISVNRPEWNFVDMGLTQTGAIHIPVYPTINEDDLLEIIKETETNVIFVSGKFLIKKMLQFQKEYPFIKHIISLDNTKEVLNFEEFIKIGKKNLDLKLIEKKKTKVDPEDLASILYTSGTTSTPKGVMLTHKNHLHNTFTVVDTIKLNSSMKILTYLPLSHSYERMVNYVSQYLGMSIYYNENLANILFNFKQVKPHILITVPLLLEKVYNGIMEKGDELKGIQKFVFKWAVRISKKFEHGKEYPWFYNQQRALADKLVFSKWREVLGGDMQKIICGGAALQREIYNIFWAANIPVYEGYGLTEGSPLISYNTENFNKPGSVGQILSNVIAQTATDGELLVKGGNIMKGYYKHPELTEAAIDKNGWLHTGDIAKIDENGFLTITGRKKDAFKSAAGTFVYPESIENKLKLSSFIDQVLVAGANQKHLIAIIVPNFDYLKKWAKNNNVSFTDEAELSQNPIIKENILLDFKSYNLMAKEGQKVLDAHILKESWTIENREITPSMKIRRAKLLGIYADLIHSFYKG